MLQRHSEATTAAAINYDNPLVVQYHGEGAIADDLGRLLVGSCAEALKIAPQVAVRGTII